MQNPKRSFGSVFFLLLIISLSPFANSADISRRHGVSGNGCAHH